jgi:hypothetical protein
VTPAERRRQALRRIAADDPELAARLVLMTLPAAASRIPGTLTYALELDGHGTYRVSVSAGGARVDEGARDGEEVDFRLAADAPTLVELATGASPLKPHAERAPPDPGKAAAGAEAARDVRGRHRPRRGGRERRSPRPRRHVPLAAIPGRPGVDEGPPEAWHELRKLGRRFARGARRGAPAARE